MYEINRVYKEFITNREAILASLNQEGLTLKFLWKNPDTSIIESLKNEPFFQLYFKNEIMFLLIKFNGIKWVDVPCVFPESVINIFASEYTNFPCKIILINSNTGKVFVKEQFFMPKGITKGFIQGIHLQKNLSKKNLTEKINSIRSSFSASEMSVLSLGNAR